MCEGERGEGGTITPPATTFQGYLSDSLLVITVTWSLMDQRRRLITQCDITPMPRMIPLQVHTA